MLSRLLLRPCRVNWSLSQQLFEDMLRIFSPDGAKWLHKASFCHSCTTRGSVKLQGLRSLLRLSLFNDSRRVERCPGRILSIAALRLGHLGKISVRLASGSAESGLFGAESCKKAFLEKRKLTRPLILMFRVRVEISGRCHLQTSPILGMPIWVIKSLPPLPQITSLAGSGTIAKLTVPPPQIHRAVVYRTPSIPIPGLYSSSIMVPLL